MSSSNTFFWFQLFDSDTGQLYMNTTADKVSLSSSADVAEFRKAVKAEYPNKLSFVDAGDLIVYKNKSAFDKRNAAVDDVIEKPLEADSRINSFGKSKKEALIVVVPSSTCSSLKSFRQMRYKSMSVEASCRMYLDAIALKLATLYIFDFKNYRGPTIGDVIFAAKVRKRWSFHLAKRDYQVVSDDGFSIQFWKGHPITNIRLPDIFTSDEWSKLKCFNKDTSKLIHDANVPRVLSGRRYIVIPHEESIQENVLFLKTLGTKSFLFLQYK